MAAPDQRGNGPDDVDDSTDDTARAQTEDVEGLDPLEGLMNPEEGENSPTGDAAAPPPG